MCTPAHPAPAHPAPAQDLRESPGYHYMPINIFGHTLQCTDYTQFHYLLQRFAIYESGARSWKQLHAYTNHWSTHENLGTLAKLLPNIWCLATSGKNKWAGGQHGFRSQTPPQSPQNMLTVPLLCMLNLARNH